MSTRCILRWGIKWLLGVPALFVSCFWGEELEQSGRPCATEVFHAYIDLLCYRASSCLACKPKLACGRLAAVFLPEADRFMASFWQPRVFL